MGWNTEVPRLIGFFVQRGTPSAAGRLPAVDAVPILQRVAVVIAGSLRRLIALQRARRLRPLRLRQSGGNDHHRKNGSSNYRLHGSHLRVRASAAQRQRPEGPSSLARLCPGIQWSATRRLLRARRERPCRRAAKQRYEVAAFHSMASSARPSSVIGKVRPSTFAVLRLMTSSTFTACITGRSTGFAPLRIFPV